MTTSTSSRTVSRPVLRIVVVLVVAAVALTSIVLGMFVFAHARFESFVHGDSRPSEAWRIADGTSISGFTRAGLVADNGSAPGAAAFFVGPAPAPDPIAVISVPTMTLKPVLLARNSPESVYVDREKHQQVVASPGTPAWQFPNPDYASRRVAQGERPDGCDVWVSYLSKPQSDSAPGQFELTADQAAGVRSGSLIFVEVIVNGCGR